MMTSRDDDGYDAPKQQDTGKRSEEEAVVVVVVPLGQIRGTIQRGHCVRGGADAEC